MIFWIFKSTCATILRDDASVNQGLFHVCLSKLLLCSRRLLIDQS